MSWFSDAVSSVGHFVSGAVNTVENIGSDVVKAGEGFIGGAVSDVIHNPLDLLNPFAVVEGGVKGAVSEFENPVLTAKNSPFTDISKYIGAASDSSTSDLGGSSIEAVLLQLAAKERDRLAGKVDQLKNLQAPGPNASAQDQSNFDTTKANLMADIQSIENSIQQITTMATNVQKNENDTNMAIVRNIA
jgi:hypothetical protein